MLVSSDFQVKAVFALPRKPFMVWRSVAQRWGMKEASGLIRPVCHGDSVFGGAAVGVAQR